jgi:putative endonuclease
MTNKMHTVLYTGVTNNLQKRIFQHKDKTVPSFTGHYNINSLVFYEEFSDAYNAISREKQIKSWSRKRKMELVDQMNPHWEDLYKKL